MTSGKNHASPCGWTQPVSAWPTLILWLVKSGSAISRAEQSKDEEMPRNHPCCLGPRTLPASAVSSIVPRGQKKLEKKELHCCRSLMNRSALWRGGRKREVGRESSSQGRRWAMGADHRWMRCIPGKPWPLRQVPPSPH